MYKKFLEAITKATEKEALVKNLNSMTKHNLERFQLLNYESSKQISVQSSKAKN